MMDDLRVSPNAERGAQLVRAGSFAEALPILEQAVADNTGDEPSWKLLGAARSATGDAAGAARAFAEAARLNPTVAKNHYNLAVALQGTGDREGARIELEKALALDGQYDQARVALQALRGGAVSSSGRGDTAAASAPPQGDALGAIGGLTTSAPSTSAAAADRAEGGDDLAAVGGGASAYASPPSSPLTPGYAAPPVPNLRPAAADTPGFSAPPLPVLGMNYGEAANTSGTKTEVPDEIARGWNWGAFQFNWIWLANHKLGLAAAVLLIVSIAINFLTRTGSAGAAASIAALVVDIAVSVWLGLNGNRLGWRNRKFNSVDDFRACQRIWMNWAIPFFVLRVIVYLFAVIAIMALSGIAALRR